MKVGSSPNRKVMTLNKNGQSGKGNASLDFDFQAKSSTELLQQFKKVKLEKMHEPVQGHTSRKDQQMQSIPVQGELPMKSNVSQMHKFIQKQDARKQLMTTRVNQVQGFDTKKEQMKFTTRDVAKLQEDALKHEQGRDLTTKKVNLQHEKVEKKNNIGKAQVQGYTQKKDSRREVTSKSMVQAEEHILKHDQSTQSMSQNHASRQIKRIIASPAMLVDDFLLKNTERDEVGKLLQKQGDVNQHKEVRETTDDITKDFGQKMHEPLQGFASRKEQMQPNFGQSMQPIISNVNQVLRFVEKQDQRKQVMATNVSQAQGFATKQDQRRETMTRKVNLQHEEIGEINDGIAKGSCEKRSKSKYVAMSINDFLAKKRKGGEVGKLQKDKDVSTQMEDEETNYEITKGFGQKKRKSACPTMFDDFLEQIVGPNEVEESLHKNILAKELEEVAETNDEIVGEALVKAKKTRGRTMCPKIHARTLQERVKVTLDEDGNPIGPEPKVVSELSNFLGTIARNSNFCPLTYTNWKAVPENIKTRMWKFVNTKFIIPMEGERAILKTIHESWRLHKHKIKKRHFDKYTTMAERLKNCPKDIPESHFRQLIDYWKDDDMQTLCAKNKKNVSQQNCRHRMGPESSAVVRAKLRAMKENGDNPTQVDVYIKSRQGNKGKSLDQETHDTISKLQDLINSGEPAKEAFQSVLGKEKPGRVRCYGRNVTLSSLKRKEELEAIEQNHKDEVASLQHEIQKTSKDVHKLRTILKCVLQQSHPEVNIEDLEAVLESYSSDASGTHVDNQRDTYVGGQNQVHDDEGDDLIDMNLVDKINLTMSKEMI